MLSNNPHFIAALAGVTLFSIYFGITLKALKAIFLSLSQNACIDSHVAFVGFSFIVGVFFSPTLSQKAPKNCTFWMSP